MRQPTISPAFMALICPSRTREGRRATFKEQAAACGLAFRQFNRLISRPWQDWKMAYALRWCDYCGFNFWELPDSTVPASQLCFERWHPVSIQGRRALVIAVTAQGVKPTPTRINRMARLLQKVADAHDRSRNPPGNPVGTQALPQATGAVPVG